MTTRLDKQRPPVKLHTRANVRWQVRGYDSVPHPVWGDFDPTPGGANKGVAKPGTSYPTEATVTAEDATNAAKLTGLGYVANPTTAWTPGQCMTVGAYRFSWTSTAWAAGPVPTP